MRTTPAFSSGVQLPARGQILKPLGHRALLGQGRQDRSTRERTAQFLASGALGSAHTPVLGSVNSAGQDGV